MWGGNKDGDAPVNFVTLQRVVRVFTVLLLPVWAHAQPFEVLVTDARDRPLQGIGVVVETTPTSPPPAIPPHAVIDQHDEQFVPRVSIVQRGTLIEFPNTDRVQHHVYSFSPVKRFELPLYRGNHHPPVLFDQTGIAVLGCNIHDHMVGYVLIVDTPYFAFSDGSGRARFASLPNDPVKVTVWHPDLRIGYGAISRSLTLDNDQRQLTISVPGSASARQETSLSWNDY